MRETSGKAVHLFDSHVTGYDIISIEHRINGWFIYGLRLMVEPMLCHISNGGFKRRPHPPQPNAPKPSGRLGRRSASHGWWFCIPSLCHGKRRWREVSTSINWVPRLSLGDRGWIGPLKKPSSLDCWIVEGGKPESWFTWRSQSWGFAVSFSYQLILPIAYPPWN